MLTDIHTIGHKMKISDELVQSELLAVEDEIEYTENAYDKTVDRLARLENKMDSLVARRNRLKRA